MPRRCSAARTLSGVSPCGTLNFVSPVFRSIAVSTPYGGFAIGKPSNPEVKPRPPPATRVAAATAGDAADAALRAADAPRAPATAPRPRPAGAASQIGTRFAD